MSKKTSSDEEVSDQPTLIAPGELLRRARRERGLAAEEVMLQLGVTQQVFNALEDSEFSALPSPMYVKGYIKRYCSVLGISDCDALASLEAHLDAQGIRQGNPSIRLVGAPQKKPKLYKFLVPVILVLLLGVLFWKVGISQVAELELFENEPSISSSTVVKPALQLTPPFPVEEIVTADVPGDGESGHLTSTPVGSTHTDAAEQIKILSIKVLQQSWVEVQDAKGDVLVADLKQSGSDVNVSGVAPFSVELGYAPGVELTYAGEKWNVSPIAQDNTATLKIGD